MADSSENITAQERCADCRYRSANPYINPDRGTAEFANIMFACKRRAPVATGGMYSPSATIWPTVSDDDWCGEFIRNGAKPMTDSIHISPEPVASGPALLLPPAHVIADQICGCANRDQHRRDVALIEADRVAVRAKEIAAIVAWIRTEAIRAWGADCTGRDETQFIADAIERGDHLPPPPTDNGGE